MDIEVRLDSQYKEPKVLILTEAMTEEVSALLKKLSEESPKVIAGFQGDVLRIIEEQALCRVYIAGGKVYAETEKDTYVLRMRLYELEERLNRSRFVRISQSEIVNLKKVRHFDLSFAGTISVTLINGTTTYVSRRNVTKIKKLLGI